MALLIHEMRESPRDLDVVEEFCEIGPWPSKANVGQASVLLSSVREVWYEVVDPKAWKARLRLLCSLRAKCDEFSPELSHRGQQ